MGVKILLISIFLGGLIMFGLGKSALAAVGITGPKADMTLKK